MQVLTSLRTKQALLVLGPIILAAAAILLTLNAREALLAQHSESQPGFGVVLLGREIIAFAAVGILAVGAIWIGSNLLVARGKLLSAAAPIAATSRPRTHTVRGRGGDMDRLFSSVTHDLRSPLTSIKAASTLLIDHESELEGKDRHEMLETIREGADTLDRMITNALQLSRNQSGELRPRRIPVSMDEVAARTLERLRYRLREHPVVFVIPDDLPEIPLDVAQIDQALGNLLENAAAFSPIGTEIALILQLENGSMVVRVEDRGPGIPADQRERVFQPFVRLASGGGPGLGLPISRAIVEAHGGRIQIEDSRGGGGTVVLVELPLGVSTVVVPELIAKGRA